MGVECLSELSMTSSGMTKFQACSKKSLNRRIATPSFGPSYACAKASSAFQQASSIQLTRSAVILAKLHVSKDDSGSPGNTPWYSHVWPLSLASHGIEKDWIVIGDWDCDIIAQLVGSTFVSSITRRALCSSWWGAYPLTRATWFYDFFS